MGKRVRLTNSQLNGNGFRILTEGLDTAQYERNPVLLWMHQRGVVIGRMKDLKREGDEITAEPEFDEVTELSRQLKAQWEKDSIKMVSVGIEVVELSDDTKLMVPGQTAPTVTKSKLFEVSLVDIGANDDAIKLTHNGKIISLSRDGENPLIQLVNKKENIMELKQIALLLGMPEDATREQIEAKVKELSSLAKEVAELKKEKEALTLSAIEETVDGAVRERRLTADRKTQFVELGKKVGVEDLKKTLAAIPVQGRVTEMISQNGGSAMAYKSWKEVPAAELALMKKNDPAQYKRLYREEFGIDFKEED